ncbi:small heat shock protein, chloroplastic [Neltuma alba]|uniref:small heat shock protein, chloroplastic n=1 Tax=Neltuma alba TaxID=207710 RepID=UPI0010A3DFA6|nr:small heat shock protein, chloroplastic-like [Prosopis alba]
MTQALSSLLGVRLPSPYGSSSSSFRALSSSSRSLNVPRSFKPVKVMASGDIRGKPEHLRRPPMNPSHLKRRVAQPVELWDRFPTAKAVQKMMETMERMMEDPFAFSTGEWPMPVSDRGGYPRGRTPWEVKEGEKEYKMRFDMPGMTKEDVKVWVEEKVLVVKAEKERKKNGDEGEEDDDDDGEVWSAKSYGRYNSRIVLPENVAFEKIKAEVKDGVLYITMPKASSSSRILDIHVQ